MNDKITAALIRGAIHEHFAPPRYAVLFEVTNATGAQHTRSADAMVMSCWPSMGLELHGMEIKVTKWDWRRERERPEKAEPMAAYCDRWSLVTGPGVVEDISEIPPAWGWLEWNGKRFATKREAAKNKEPKAINRLFLAALLRRAAKTDDALLEAMVAERMEAHKAKLEEEVLRRTNERSKNYAALLEAVQTFERETGIGLAHEDEWGYLRTEDGKKIGAMVKALRESLGRSWSGLADLEEQLRRTLDHIAAVQEATGLPPAPKRTQKKKRNGLGAHL